MDSFFEQLHFPYKEVRAGQDECMKKIFNTIDTNSQILVCAPTGLGKTISALAPSLYLAKQNDLKVICLTSRQTQVNQIISTIEEINKKKDVRTTYISFIGKKNMCIRTPDEFSTEADARDLCKRTKDPGKCNYCKRKRLQDEIEIEDLIEILKKENLRVEEYVRICRENNFCPYQVALLQAQRSDVIICDYNYLFMKSISEGFVGSLGKALDECILIIDEAHNLPERIRSAYSSTLSTEILKNARDELRETKLSLNEFENYLFYLEETLGDIYLSKQEFNVREFLITKQEFLEKYLSKVNEPLELVIEKFERIEAVVLKEENRTISHNGRIAQFLKTWESYNENEYVRILEISSMRGKDQLHLRVRCLDPAPITKEVLNDAHSSILMSATLSPLEMYRDLLGIEKATLLELGSPFDKENQLTLVDQSITTKYTQRSPKTFREIGERIKLVLTEESSRNAIFFFPSYDLMEKITSSINLRDLNRRVLKEKRYMSKQEKEAYIDEFKSAKGFNTKSKVLFAVTSGSFAEGLDLPNEALEIVCVVGLPLGVPDHYTQAVIRHFEKKFRKGQLYGYIYPALSKIIQAGGRCIRTKEDKGAVLLFDNRFLWSVYAQGFPKHWHIRRSRDLKKELNDFFGS